MKVSRRQWVGWLGAAAVSVPTFQAAARTVPRGRGTPHPSSAAVDALAGSPAPLSAAALLAPLIEGSSLDAWRIERLGGLRAGAFGIDLSDSRGNHFHIDICRHDPAAGAPVPPARTDLCDLFVANEGSGSNPTDEALGLAAMALSEVVRAHEHQVDLGGLLTLRQRLARHGDDVRRRVEG